MARVAARVAALVAALLLGVARAVDPACTVPCADAAPPAGCTPLAATGLAPSPVQDLTVATCVRLGSSGGGAYVFRFVNVVAGGVLWVDDDGGAVDIRAASVLVEQGGRVVAGRWCRPFGCAGGSVQFGLWGADPSATGTITTAAGIRCIGRGDASNSCYDPALTATPTCCLGNAAGDVYNPCNTTAAPCGTTAANSARFEGYSPAGLNFDGPGNHFGFKVLAVAYGGSLELFGRNGVAAADFVDPDLAPPPATAACAVPADEARHSSEAWAQLSGESWVRLGAAATPGATTLTLGRPVRWAAGTKIVLTTTDWYPSHTEQLEVASDVVDSATVPLVAPVRFRHVGDRYLMQPVWTNTSGNPNTDVDMRAAVGVLTRSIRIYSLGATATDAFPTPAACTAALSPANPACYFGGHTIVRQGFARYQVQGVEFYQLGQGGRMGHYPVHFHVAKQAYYTHAFVRDASSWDSMTRFFTIHGTHGVALERNVGFLSVGHGYYLEDATEINNVLCHNLATYLRAPLLAYVAAQPPSSPTARAIPGILPAVVDPNSVTGGDEYQPTAFWTMNMWNDVTGNMAAGVLGWGSCFWLLGSHVSGSSRVLSWTSLTGTEEDYAGWADRDHARIAPVKRFRANTCTTAYTGLQTSMGLYPKSPFDAGYPGVNGAARGSVPNPYAITADMLPNVDQNFSPTRVSNSSIYFINPYITCQKGVQLDQYPPNPDIDNYRLNTALCSAVVIERFRTSFNWAEVNFGSVWLRGFWFAVVGSVITDQAFGGLGFVSGGSWIDALPGMWMLVTDGIFIGLTQPDNPDAGPLGPAFDESACIANTCPIVAEGTGFTTAGGLNPVRLVTIYDGPFFADHSIFVAVNNFTCNPAVGSTDCGIYRNSVQPEAEDGEMRMNVINAAIGWKQSNGFYYPPAFAFRNTAFDATSLRHNVLDIEASYVTSAPPNQAPYRLGPVELANKLGVRSIDASTILIDVDGTLTGVRSPATGRTSSVSRNSFYDAPTVIPECDSFGVNTSPFDLVTTVVTVAAQSTMHPQWYKVDTYWGRIDKNLPFNAPYNAYGTYVQIPLYRQLLLSTDVPCDTPICSGISPQNNMFSCTHATMMAGSQVWSAPMLTMNNMVYFVDTNRQPLTGPLCSKFTSNFRDEVLFVPSQSYVLYQLYPQPTTRITYQVHVGTSFQPATDGFYARIFTVYNVDADSNAQPIIPVPALTGDVSFNSATGVLTVVLDNAWIRDDFNITAAEAYTRCLPRDICDYDEATQSCVVAASVTDPVDRVTYRDICGYWATRASGASENVGDTLTDCPANGCLAYVFRLPADFTAQPYEVVGKPLRKTMTCTPEFSAFNVSLVTAADIPGNTCTGSPNTLCYQPPPDKVFVSGPKYCDVHGSAVLCDCSGASGNVTFTLTSVNKPSYRSITITSCNIVSSANALQYAPLTSLQVSMSTWASGPSAPAALGLGATLQTLVYDRVSGISTIGANAFANLTGLQTLSLIALYQLTTVDPNAFAGLTNLTSFDFYQNYALQALPAPVFRQLQNLQSLDLQSCGLQAVSASLFTNLRSLTSLSLANNQLATLPPGLFFTGSSLLLSSNIDISGNPFTGSTVPSTFGNASINVGACNSVCPTSCFDAPSNCCSAVCRTCAGSASYCTSCMSGVTPVAGSCVPPEPERTAVATKADGGLNGIYTAAFFPGYATCWVKLGSTSFSNGYALDGKLCCRKIGQMSAAQTCLTGCGSPPPESSPNYAVLAPIQPTDVGKRCFTDCYYL